jgi:hypothetical protein
MSGGAYDGPVYNFPQYQFTSTAAFLKQKALAQQGCDAYGAGLVPLIRLPGWNLDSYGFSAGPYAGAYAGSYLANPNLLYGPQAPWATAGASYAGSYAVPGAYPGANPAAFLSAYPGACAGGCAGGYPGY